MDTDETNAVGMDAAGSAAGASELSARPRWPVWALAALLIVVAGVSLHRAAVPKADFKYFYLDARYVWTHRALNPKLSDKDGRPGRQLPFYLPVVPLLLSPLAAFGPKPAAVFWTLGHVVALAYSIKVLRGWVEADSSGRSHVLVLAAGLVALPAIIETAHFNQLSFFVLALVLAGLAALERGAPLRAGLWLGLATVLKLLPAVFAVWLVLKRRWTALGALAATAVVVALLPCLAVFGPGDTGNYHRLWWEYNLRGAAARGKGDAKLRSHLLDYHNQSLTAVLMRSTWSEHPYRTRFQPVHLSERTSRGLARALLIGLAAALLWLTRRRWKNSQRQIVSDERRRWRIEAAVYLLAMLIFAPLLRTYYLVCALPALILLVQDAVRATQTPARRLGRVGLALWLLGMLAWTSEAARAYGAHLIVLVALAGILLWLGAQSWAYNRRRTRQAL